MDTSTDNAGALPRIRLAEPDDAPRIAPLFDAYRQFYEQPADAARALAYIAERLARQQSEILLAEDNQGRLLGFCQLYPSFCSVEAAPIFVLYDLFVSPATRRTGAARALMQAAAELGRLRGKARLDLSTAHGNLAAQALYESLGWQRDTQFRYYSLGLR
jgi:ribosomal protein S18 acetylase RimI-like enzyme